MSNKYLILFAEPRMGGAYKMGPKPRTVQEDTACTGCSQSDTIYCTGCAQNCILLHSQRGRGDRYCRWCTHWGPTSLIVDCKTLRCIRCKRFKCKRRQCMACNWNISHVIALAMYGGSVWLIGADGSSGRGRLHSATPGPKTLLHFWSVLSAIK